MKKKRVVEAWALVEDEQICHYYGLAYVCLTKRQALIEARSKNQFPLNHKMKVVPCQITYEIPTKKRGKV